MTIVVRPLRKRDRAVRIRCSDGVSRADVASSSTRMGASFRNARARARRWRCPPERSRPFSPTTESSPSGRSSRKSVTNAASCGLPDGFAGGRLEPSVGDVRGNRVVEEHDLLAHDSDLAAQRRESELPDIDPVETNRSGQGVEEPGQEVGKGRLPGPGGPDQGQGLPGLDDEGDVPERVRSVVAVPEHHRIELDPPLRRVSSRVPESGSPASLTSPNTLSAAASPCCRLATTVARCRMGRSNSIVAAMKLTKLPMVTVRPPPDAR